jgi:hypothetical protein
MSTLKVDTIQGKTTAGTVAMPAGMVIQTVATTDNTELALSTGQTPTNYSQLNTSITPKFSTSKILVRVDFGALQYGGNDRGSATDFPSSQVGSNDVVSHKAHFQINLEVQTWDIFQPSMAILHAPSTTDALVYQVYFWSENTSGVCKINKNYRDYTNDASTVATMTLMEISQ